MKKADICLVDPPHSAPTPYNLAIPYLSANLKKHGFSTKIIDASALRIGPDELAEVVSQHDPRFVGITVFSSQRVRPAQKAILAIKKKMPNVTVVCGGIMATLCPEEFAPHCDLVVMGPGEERIVDIVRDFPKRDVFDLPGVAWFDRKNEKLVQNPREFLSDLDALPFPDWDGVLEDLSLDRVFFYNEISGTKELVIPVLTSRGCPFRCAFCSNWVLGAKNVLKRSAKSVAEELRHWKEHLGISLFHFCDDNFGFYPRHVADVCDAITDADIKVRWRCTISANAASHEPTVQKLKEAGCVKAFIGVESGDPEILKTINKPIKLSEVQTGVDLLEKAGIPTTISFIIGLPGDTEETVLRSMKFAAGLHSSDFTIGPANPLPKTALLDMVEEDGGMVDTGDAFDPSPPFVRYVTPGLKGWDLLKLCVFFFSYWAYHNPSQAVRLLTARMDWTRWSFTYRVKITLAVIYLLLYLLICRMFRRPLRFPRWAREKRNR